MGTYLRRLLGERIKATDAQTKALGVGIKETKKIQNKKIKDKAELEKKNKLQ